MCAHGEPNIRRERTSDNEAGLFFMEEQGSSHRPPRRTMHFEISIQERMLGAKQNKYLLNFLHCHHGGDV